MTDVANLVTILSNAREAGYTDAEMLAVADRALAAAEQRGAAAERERIEKSIVSYSLTQAAYAHDIQVCDDLLAAIRAGQEG